MSQIVHRPKALIITAPGINCDLELADAFELAGAHVESVLLARLLREPARLDHADLIGLPGGFSYGDDVAAGRVMAHLMRAKLYGALAAAIERGTPIIAPCNGFQIAVQIGLLPGPEAGMAWPDKPPRPTVSLLQNQQSRFRDCWTHVEVPHGTRSIWTANLTCLPEAAVLPSAHGEGRLYASDETLDGLEAAGQVALRYLSDENFNGSCRSIAGICDASGLVLGLMPHPERFTRWTHHPTWTRFDELERTGAPLGLAMFRAAVDYARACV